MRRILILLLLILTLTSVRAFLTPASLNRPALIPSAGTFSYHQTPPPSFLRAPPPSTTTALSLVSPLTALHGDNFYCLTAIFILSTFGIVLERKTTVGKALSAPLATMALALVLANLSVIPFTSTIYTIINQYFVPLAIPLLLFDSNLFRIFKDTGTLLLAFGVGALATIAGTLLAFPVVPMPSLGPDAWKVACALAARHIGGAVNFVAVADTLKLSAETVSAAIAADNVVVAAYFAMLFAISESGEDLGSFENIDVKDPESIDDSTNVTLSSMATALSVAATLVTLGKALTKAILPPGVSSLPVTSTLTVIAATAFPSFFSRLREAGTALGVLFVQMFFAASGAAGSIGLVLKKAPSLFAFSTAQIAIHFGFLNVVGRFIFRLPSRELYLASNANVGGPTTAAAMAQAKQWKQLVLPALLIGILGYATATGLALALGPIVRGLPTLR